MELCGCTWISALVLASSAAPPPGTAPGAAVLVVADDPFAAEFDVLSESFSTAREEHYKRLRALGKVMQDQSASQEERDKAGRELWALQESGPEDTFRDKFIEFAKKAKGHDSAAKAWIEVLGLVRGPLQSLPTSPMSQALDALLTDHVQSKELAKVGYAVDRETVGEARFDTLIRTMREKSPHPEVQASGLRALADSKASPWDATPEQLKLARPLWVELGEKYAGVMSPHEKTYGQMAEGKLFWIDNLQIGCVAPDFETVDETGAKFKLSDYRGKVVVVDFWGYW
jgi:hypothetical protein